MKDKQKIIIIDYDDTYTLMPDLFDRFIYQIKARGYKVYCVTMRYENVKDEADEVRQLCPAVFDKIVFTNRKAKLPVLQKLNINPCFWIDDNPLAIYLDAEQSFGKVV